MAVNLDIMSLAELLALQKQLPTVIAQRQEEVRKEVLSKASQLAARHGMTLEELVSNGRKKHGPRYRNPNDHSQVWSGVGSRPRWVRDWIASGRPMEDLLIDKEPD